MQSMQTISQTHEMLQAGWISDPGGLTGVLGNLLYGTYTEVLKPLGGGVLKGLYFIGKGLFGAL